jgi:hypothetical protein
MNKKIKIFYDNMTNHEKNVQFRSAYFDIYHIIISNDL